VSVFLKKFCEEIGYGFAGGICTCWSKLPVLLAHDLSLRNVRIRLANWRRSIYEHGVFVMMQVFKLSFLGQAAYKKLYISISIHRKMKNSIGNVRKKGRA